MIQRKNLIVYFFLFTFCWCSFSHADSYPLFDHKKIIQELAFHSSQFNSNEKQNSEETTRSGLWNTLRRKKEASLKPEKVSRIERFFMGFDESGLGLNWNGVYPKFGGIDSGGGAGLAAGVRFWRRDLFGTPLEVQAESLFSIRRYQTHTIQFGKIMKKDINRLMGIRGYGGIHNFDGLDKKEYDFFLFGTYRYRYLAQEDFYGLGPDSQLEDRTDYLQKDSNAFGTIAYRLTSWSLLAGNAGYLKVEILPGRDSRFPDTPIFFDDTNTPGLVEQSDFIHGGGSLVVDLRDDPSNPHSGFFFGFDYYRYHDNGKTNFNFSRTTYDLRGYFPVWAENRTLAIQMYTALNNPDSGNRVPFYLMETLGGPDSLRGYESMRFRDDNLVLVSTEYRWEPAPFWELALFYDAGKVYPNGTDWNLNDLQDGYGVGVRFKLPKAVLLRLDLGRSSEGTHFYFRLASPSF